MRQRGLGQGVPRFPLFLALPCRTSPGICCWFVLGRRSCWEKTGWEGAREGPERLEESSPSILRISQRFWRFLEASVPLSRNSTSLPGSSVLVSDIHSPKEQLCLSKVGEGGDLRVFCPGAPGQQCLSRTFAAKVTYLVK